MLQPEISAAPQSARKPMRQPRLARLPSEGANDADLSATGQR